MITDPLQLFRLDGRVALVTGAAGGLGKAVTEMLAGAGAQVVMADLDAQALNAAVAEYRSLGLKVTSLTLDVSDEANVDQALESIIASAGRIDILVNNAGIGARTPSTDLAKERWDRVLEVNLTGSFLCARAAARVMLAARSGTIVNIASIMGMVGNAVYPNASYHASKGALVNLTRALAIEWARAGVRVNCIAPGFVMTPLTEKLLADEKIAAALLARTPIGRLADPSDVAAAVLYLVSDAATMVTGHVLAVDGGWLAQ